MLFSFCQRNSFVLFEPYFDYWIKFWTIEQTQWHIVFFATNRQIHIDSNFQAFFLRQTSSKREIFIFSCMQVFADILNINRENVQIFTDICGQSKLYRISLLRLVLLKYLTIAKKMLLQKVGLINKTLRKEFNIKSHENDTRD